MPVCVPIKDMRDTAKFSELVETTPGPVTVTKNGYSKFVVLRSEDYDLMVPETSDLSWRDVWCWKVPKYSAWQSFAPKAAD